MSFWEWGGGEGGSAAVVPLWSCVGVLVWERGLCRTVDPAVDGIPSFPLLHISGTLNCTQITAQCSRRGSARDMAKKCWQSRREHSSPEPFWHCLGNGGRLWLCEALRSFSHHWEVCKCLSRLCKPCCIVLVWLSDEEKVKKIYIHFFTQIPPYVLMLAMLGQRRGGRKECRTVEWA